MTIKTTPTIQCGLGAALLLISLAVRVPAQENKAPNVRTVEELVSVTAKVQSIDLAKRELTLKGPLGNSETVVVSDKVKRLNEIKPGDEVTATYYLGMAAELREPTDEENKAPFVVLGGKGRASSDQDPAAGGLRVIRVVATIEGLDRPTQTVTLKGPMGRYHIVRVKDPSVLEKPRLGDTVVVTCAEGLAVSVEKSPAKSKE
jgi:hypothetical protein